MTKFHITKLIYILPMQPIPEISVDFGLMTYMSNESLLIINLQALNAWRQIDIFQLQRLKKSICEYVWRDNFAF